MKGRKSWTERASMILSSLVIGNSNGIEVARTIEDRRLSKEMCGNIFSRLFSLTEPSRKTLKAPDPIEIYIYGYLLSLGPFHFSSSIAF